MSSADEAIAGPGFVLRPWRRDDAGSLRRHADDAEVSRFLSDRFPYPYTAADAEAFLDGLAQTGTAWAIAIDAGAAAGEAIGGIGVEPGRDVHRLTGQIGYWLGRAYWGRGLMSAALPLWCAHLFARYPFERLQAIVYAGNPASAKVLERSGFVLEGIQRRAAIKRGEILDVLLYARLRSAQDGAADRR
ncbi:MAG TPA: GNAT family protein [Dokdonella sp.]|uniref:GNAT family N-acetyltransferase n=1 Tax=Dokdonella sp. TaxID=2291710 RepID=UPI002C6F2FD7|nr:GNAT family protein [Dokdonella sp.]HUD41506.1 GNAT family protein [Dokdonella sp.]